MNMPTVAYTGTGVYTVTFQEPSNKGAVDIAISYYEIMFLKSDGVTWASIPSTCDGADATVKANLNC